MSVRIEHKQEEQLNWFITFTCYKWLHLFELTNSYDLVYNWFYHLKKTQKAEVLAYVIMPNHLHAILRLNNFQADLNKIIANGKRFMAYEIIDRLQPVTMKPESSDALRIHALLQQGINESDIKKGQKHRVFEPSFDAKSLYNIDFFNQKPEYIHNNPVSGKWSLVSDYRDYEHSSAAFYELGLVKGFRPKDYREIIDDYL